MFLHLSVILFTGGPLSRESLSGRSLLQRTPPPPPGTVEERYGMHSCLKENHKVKRTFWRGRWLSERENRLSNINGIWLWYLSWCDFVGIFYRCLSLTTGEFHLQLGLSPQKTLYQSRLLFLICLDFPPPFCLLFLVFLHFPLLFC